MKKQIILAVSIFIFIQIAGALVAESSAAEKLDLMLRLNPGQKYGVRLIMELKRTETIEGRQEHESFMFARGIGFDVKQVDDNSVASVEVTFRTLQVNIARGDFRCEYDSTRQSIADGYSKVPEIEAASAGEGFVIKLTPKGEVIEIKGLEEMYSRIFEKVEEWNEKYLIIEMVPCGETEGSSSSKTTRSPTTLSWKEMSESYKKVWREVTMHNIKSTYSEKEIGNMLSDMIMTFPDQSLAVGDAWADKVKIWGKNSEIDGTYTLKNSKNGMVAIDLGAKRTAEERPFSWVNNEGREVGFKLVGSCDGSFEIDQNTGWLMRSKSKARFTGKVIDPEANNQTPESIMEQELIIVEPME